jgi:asparagine synthase (glutamine-hydrolysing)
MLSVRLTRYSIFTMCGVLGVFGNISLEFQERAIQVGDRALYHRGPDFGGHVANNNGLLVVRRLSIVDTSNDGSQPMSSRNGRHWLAFNGMLYNHQELREVLKRDYDFRGRSDTEVVAAALTRWGSDALRRFEGMFALLWWDEVSGDVLAAVDKLAIKPLLYLPNYESGLICSSELGPILDLVPTLNMDCDTLGTYVSQGLLDHSNRTLIRDVRQLRRGEMLVRRNGQVEVGRYHEFEPAANSSALTREELQDALESSMARHLSSDRPVGISLSSGLDSNGLRILASRANAEISSYFTRGYRDYRDDEMRRIGADAHVGAVPLVSVLVTPEMVRAWLPKVIARTLEPTGGLGMLGAFATYQAASDRGAKVMLIGEGADELFGGYSYYTSPGLPNDKLREPRLSSVRAPDGTTLSGPLLSGDFSFDLIPPDLGTPREARIKRSDLRSAMWADLAALKLPKLLRFQDRMSMYHGVEARLPYLDMLLVEASMRIRDDDLVRDGATKVLLRETLRLLGYQDASRPKVSVPTPQSLWLQTHLGDWVTETIRDSRLISEGIIDGPALERKFNQFRSSSTVTNSFFAWQIINLELWYRAFRERQQAAIASQTKTRRVWRRQSRTHRGLVARV